MLPNSLRIRAVNFAFLFGPPRIIGREEASKVHGGVCDELGHDDFAFRYSTSSAPEKPDSKGFSIELRRKEGRGLFAVTIDNENVSAPIRILLAYTWPPSLEHAKQTFDMTGRAVFSALEGDWQRVVAEARLRAQCDTRRGDGLVFLREALLAQASGWLSELGPCLSFCGVKLEVGATPPSGDDQLEGAKRELMIQVLREDRRGLYLELVSHWPQVSSVPRASGTPIDLRSIRRFDSEPSDYVKDAYDYLVGRINSLAAARGDQ